MESTGIMQQVRKLLLTMLDGVYVDAKEDKRIVGIKPKPAFRPVFQVATTKGGSGVEIMKAPGRYARGSVFVVETGEGRNRPETRGQGLAL